MPITLVWLIVISPIIFSISSAYKRRETALGYYADIKAFSRMIYFSSRDWVQDNSEESKKISDDIKNTLSESLVLLEKFLLSKNYTISENIEK